MIDAIIFSAFALFGLGVGLFVALKTYTEGRAQRRWIRVQATIKGCGVGSSEGVVEVNRIPRPATYYFPEVRYEYEYRGEHYESANLGGLDVSITSRAMAEKSAGKLARRYWAGKEVAAFVNPAQPSEAVLVRGYPGWFIALFLLFGLAWAAGFGLFAWRQFP